MIFFAEIIPLAEQTPFFCFLTCYHSLTELQYFPQLYLQNQ